MRVIDDLIVREIAGEYILVPTGSAALKIHGMINLSDSGYLLWNKLQSDCTEEELVDAILEEYEIDRETANEDVKAFISHMEQVGLLQEIGEDRNEQP